MNVDQLAFGALQSKSLGNTRGGAYVSSRDTTRSRDNVAPPGSIDPNQTRSGGMQIPGQRAQSTPGAHRLDRDGNYQGGRNQQHQNGEEVIARIRVHVQEILGRGGYNEADYDIRWANILEARHYARGNEAEQIYANVDILKDSGPLQAGFDLSALQEHWPIIAAVGGGLLLIKMLKKKS